jgi:hypothetical protein
LSLDLVLGELLRATKRQMSQRYGLWVGETGPLPDRPLTLSHRDGLLCFEVAGEVYGVPARGVWVEYCAISLREFVAMPPWILRGRSIDVGGSLDAASFNGNSLAVKRGG